MLASGSLLFAHTALEDFESADNGAHWRAAVDPALAALEDRSRAPLTPELVAPSGQVVADVSTNLALAVSPGRLWLYGPPGALWSSSDGGQHWRSIALGFPVSS